jgi:uncharacterized protein YndB with AHSA1/START domain
VAVNEIAIDAPPERVFAVLADAETYAEWVYGAQDVLDSDPEWPAVGAGLEHESGLPGVTLVDETIVLESEPPRRLVLRAKVGVLGEFRVELVLTPEGSGTRVTMTEEPVAGAARLGGPVTTAGLLVRNLLSLRKLRELSTTGEAADSR